MIASISYACRKLLKSPGFTFVAIVTLALGIGLNTTAFSLLNRLLLQSLPYRDSSTLVQVWAASPTETYASHSPGDYFDEKEQNTVFSDIAAYRPGETQSFVEPGQPPVRLGSVGMTADFFNVLGVVPQIGRLPSPDEVSREDSVTLLSNAFWREHFAADPSVIGKTVKIDGKVHTIIGVMPAAVDDPQLFQTRVSFFRLEPMRVNREFRDYGWYKVAARLKPGVTLEQAQAQIKALGERFAKDHPKTNGTRSFRVIQFPTSDVGTSETELLWTTMGLCGLVLLIGCVNLANLQLARTTRRSQEIGIRMALGSSRGQLVGMLLLESVVLSFAGGVVALLVATWSSAYVARFFDIDLPLEVRVLGFAFVASLVTGAMFGTIPAWIASRADVTVSLKSSARGSTSDKSRRWVRQGLVVAELAMALTLLAGAGFFVKGIYQLSHRNLGWDASHIVTGWIELDHDHYGEERDPRSLAFGERMSANLAQIPGAEAVAMSMDTPSGDLRLTEYRVEGQPAPEQGKELRAGYTPASPGFLRVYGLRLTEGRDFTPADRPGAPKVVIINESMARKWWPGESAIGKRIATGDLTKPDWAEVVGVIHDFESGAGFYNPGSGKLMFLIPWAQNSHRFITFNVRTSGPSEAYVEPIRKSISLLAPDLALSELVTVEDQLVDQMGFFIFLRKLLVQISGLGLLLAGLGIYGVVANLASERTREIGIRMALGAQPQGLVWMFIANGIRLACVGAVIGVVASYFLTTALSRLLPVLPGKDPLVVASVAGLLMLVALFACWIPARRTTRINPTIALRAE